VIKRLLDLRRAAEDEQGAVLLLTTVAMFAILAASAYAIDTAIQFVHQAHLQTQADAAVLAAAQDFQFPCNATEDAILTDRVLQYDGSTGLTGSPFLPVYNTQVPLTPTPATTGTGHNLVTEVNQSNYYGQSLPGDAEANPGKPCEDGYIDAKLTETNLPSFFPFFSPPHINRQARVSIEQETSASGVSSFVEPLATPTTVSVQIVNEDGSGANVGTSVSLSQSNSNPNLFSGTTTLPATVPAALLGAKVTLGGGQSSTTYNSGTPPPYGVAYTRVWSAPTSGNAPWTADFWLTPTTNPTTGQPSSCASASAGNSSSNFISSSTSTSVYLCANMTFPTLSGASLVCASVPSLTFSYGTNTGVALTCPSNNNPNGTWQSAAISLPPNAGATKFTLTNYTLTAGATPTGASGGSGGTCGTGSKACKGTFSGVEQEAFTGAYDEASSQTSNSGPLVTVAMTDTTSGVELTSVPQSTADGENVTIRVAVLGLQNETSIGSTSAELSFGTNQQNLAVDCQGNNGTGTLVLSIAAGCPGTYTIIQAGQTCPNGGGVSYCIGVASTGNKLINNLSTGMNDRIYCQGQTTGGCATSINANGATCPTSGTEFAPNYWDSSDSPTNSLNQVLSQTPPDPRILILFITGFGDTKNGNNYEPIEGFAAFYVTGWAGDPCLAPPNGSGTSGSYTNPNTSVTLNYVPDVTPPGDASGILMGHFVKYVQVTSGGGSGQCSQNTFGNCVAVLTK
jgi:Flp pilus assembly protein TadG